MHNTGKYAEKKTMDKIAVNEINTNVYSITNQ
jgi:hypothetical protein